MSTDTIQPSSASNVYEAMAQVMGMITPIAKKRQPQDGVRYNYRGIDDFLNDIQPLMASAGLFISPNVDSYELSERKDDKGRTIIQVIAKVAFIVNHRSGTSITTSTMIGMGMDYGGDKASNKAVSAAMKYWLISTFMVPTGDPQDADTPGGLIDSEQNNSYNAGAEVKKLPFFPKSKETAYWITDVQVEQILNRIESGITDRRAFIEYLAGFKFSKERRAKVKEAAVKAGLIAE